MPISRGAATDVRACSETYRAHVEGGQALSDGHAAPDNDGIDELLLARVLEQGSELGALLGCHSVLVCLRARAHKSVGDLAGGSRQKKREKTHRR